VRILKWFEYKRVVGKLNHHIAHDQCERVYSSKIKFGRIPGPKCSLKLCHYPVEKWSVLPLTYVVFLSASRTVIEVMLAEFSTYVIFKKRRRQSFCLTLSEHLPLEHSSLL
jgi:hypothetical protein